jgi:hypothetical protein
MRFSRSAAIAESTDAAPDYAEPIVGWRAWDVVDDFGGTPAGDRGEQRSIGIAHVRRRAMFPAHGDYSSETKPFYLTSEFLVYAIFMISLGIAAATDATIDSRFSGCGVRKLARRPDLPLLQRDRFYAPHKQKQDGAGAEPLTPPRLVRLSNRSRPRGHRVGHGLRPEDTRPCGR